MTRGSEVVLSDDDDRACWVHCSDKAEDRSTRLSVPWLFRERLPEVGTGLLVGPSGVGKSFLAIDLARAIATRGEFFGVKPSARAGAVIFVAEDWQGVRSRLHALGDEALPIRAAYIERLREVETQRCVRRLVDEAARSFRKDFSCGVGIIIIDTLSASGLLADENSNTECSQAMQVLGRLAEYHDCLVLVLHHPGKRDDGARGGSALFASADVVLKASPPKKAGAYTLECIKNRNATTGTWGPYVMVPHVIGRDPDGREITTLKISTAEADCRGTVEEVPPELVAAVVQAIGPRVMRKDPQSPGSVHPLLAECAKIAFITDAGKRRTKALLDALLAKGVLAQGSELINRKWRPTIFVPNASRGAELA